MAGEGKKMSVAGRCAEIARPVAEALGLIIWDVRFDKEGGSHFLRYFIDKPGGVTVEDCERFSRAMDGPLDEVDPIPESYYLEVSSPGTERTLKTPEHFAAFVGRKIAVRLYQPREGRREFAGELTGFDAAQKSLTLTENGEAHTFALTEVSSVKQYAEYNFKGADR